MSVGAQGLLLCEDVAYRVIASNLAPDHVTINRFRFENQDALAGLFGEVLTLCARAGMVRVGTVVVDGTRMAANASKEQTVAARRQVRSGLGVLPEPGVRLPDSEEPEGQVAQSLTGLSADGGARIRSRVT